MFTKVWNIFTSPLGLVFIILLCVAFVFCIIKNLFRIAVLLVIISVTIPVVFTVFWGDGTKYVSEFASFFNYEQQQKIEEIYSRYREREQESSIVNYDAVSNKWNSLMEDVKDKAKQLYSPTDTQTNIFSDD